MDLAAIQGAIGGLKSATDIARSLLQMKITVDVQAKVIELQSALLDAQNGALAATTAQFELLEKVRHLEAQLKARGDWENQKGRYALVSPWQGFGQAYALRREAANGERAHLACTNCFHSMKLVILNPTSDSKSRNTVMVCPACRASIDTGYSPLSGAKYAEDYKSGG